MKVLDLTKIVGNNSSLVTIIIGTTQTFTLTAIELVLLYVLIATAICGILVNLYFRFKDKRAAELERKRTAHEKDVKAILKGFETKRVRPK
jgi:predicted small lipoprotein YifL